MNRKKLWIAWLCLVLVGLASGKPSALAQQQTLAKFDKARLNAQREGLAWYCGWEPTFSFHRVYVRGTAVYYYRSRTAQNDRTKPTLLLIHGTTGGPEIWHAVLLSAGRHFNLTEEFDVIVVQLPGHGTSTDILRPCTFSSFADLMTEFLNRVGIHPVCYVAGLSYGGEVAFRTVAKNPSRFSGLLLIDSSGFLRPDREVCELDKEADSFKGHAGVFFSDFPLIGPLFFRRAISLCNKPSEAEVKAALQEYYGQSKAGIAYTPFIIPSLVVSDAAAKAYHTFSDHRSRFQTAMMLTQESVGRNDAAEVIAILGNLREPLRSGRLPVVLVWGEYDPFFTYQTQALAFMKHLGFDALPAVQRDRLGIMVKNAGHCVPEQAPEVTAQILLNFGRGAFQR